MARNFLRWGSDWLEQNRTDTRTDSLTVRRGSSSASVRASVGTRSHEIDGGDGLVTKIESHDYLVLATDYVFDGVATVPMAGDRFIEGDMVFVVMAPDSAHQVWQWSDAFQKTYRIHTKKVGPATSGS
jgi:hypothetical protein